MKPGIYFDFETAAYLADPCPEPSLSQSMCKVLLDYSPAHAMWQHPRISKPAVADESEPYNKAKAIGDAAHKERLGRGKDVAVIFHNDFKTNAAKAERDAAAAGGRIPILVKHHNIASEMVMASHQYLKAHEDKDAFTKGHGEVALIWQEHGIWCRALVDWLHEDMRTVDDYKTSGMSVAPHVLGMRAESAGWHIQAAFIERGLDVLDPKNAGKRRFRFVAQEQDGRPYALSVMHMNEYWLTMGRKKIAAAMEMWRSAMNTGRWPAYPARGVTPDYPKYAESRWLDREMSGEFEPVDSLMGG